MSDNEFPCCKHNTPDYADCQACADEHGMRFVDIDGKARLVHRDEFSRIRESIVRLLPTCRGWCYGSTHPDTATAAEKIAADLAEVRPRHERIAEQERLAVTSGWVELGE